MNSSTSLLYKKKYHIDLRDVDFNKRLKLSTLFSYFQDVASEASDKLGYGIEELEKRYGVAWVLIRIKAQIKQIPKFDEEISIETWPLEPGRIEIDRDYIVRDANGEIVIKAMSTWVLMDLNERKIKRSEIINLQYPHNINERALEEKFQKLKSNGNLERAYEKVIGYSDVDFNGHLNNSKYVDFIMDCFPIEDHKKYNVSSLEVNFNQEALPGDTITLYKDISDIDSDSIYIEGTNNSHVVFKAKLKITERY